MKLRIFAKLFAEAEKTVSPGTEATERIKRYIAGHPQNPVSANDIAKTAGCPRNHAALVSKGEAGLSPFEYIRRQR